MLSALELARARISATEAAQMEAAVEFIVAQNEVIKTARDFVMAPDDRLDAALERYDKAQIAVEALREESTPSAAVIVEKKS